MTEKEAPLVRSPIRSLMFAILLLFPCAALAQTLEIDAVQALSCTGTCAAPSVNQDLGVWLSVAELPAPLVDQYYCVQPLSASALSSYESGQGLLSYYSINSSGSNVQVGQVSYNDIIPPCGPNNTFPYFPVFSDAFPYQGSDPLLTVSYATPGIKTLNFDVSTVTGPVAVPSLQFYIVPAENGTNLGVCKQCLTQGGAPINLTNGNVWIQQRDYSVPGLGGGLTLARTWNSRLQDAGPPSVAGMFGQGWRSSYEESLSPTYAQNLMYWRGDGSAWNFTYNSTLNSYTLTSPPDERAQLVMNPANGGFTLTLPDGTQKLFNSQNLLAVIIDRNGNQTTLAYDGSNRLTSVTSPGGSTLSFTYGDSNNPMQATSAQDSVGTVANYTYDSSSRLTLVTYADGSKLNFTFDSNSMIATVTDSQGKLIESHSYDSQRRGLTSSRAYGADSVTLTY